MTRPIARTGVPSSQIEIHKGFFEQTLPRFQPPPIAVLRLDADWYSSTAICLEHLWDAVMPGGIVLLDDYYHWEGCSRAVHDFLSRRGAPEVVRQGRLGRVAFIPKISPATAAGV
jgi:O-methyltransferase